MVVLGLRTQRLFYFKKWDKFCEYTNKYIEKQKLLNYWNLLRLQKMEYIYHFIECFKTM